MLLKPGGAKRVSAKKCHGIWAQTTVFDKMAFLSVVCADARQSLAGIEISLTNCYFCTRPSRNSSEMRWSVVQILLSFHICLQSPPILSHAGSHVTCGLAFQVCELLQPTAASRLAGYSLDLDLLSKLWPALYLCEACPGQSETEGEFLGATPPLM